MAWKTLRVILVVTGLLMASSRIAMAQAVIVAEGSGESKHCNVFVEAYAADWCNYDFVSDSAHDQGTGSATATATAVGASATGTGKAYGQVYKLGPESAEVFAKGQFTASAQGFEDGCSMGDGVVNDASGSSHQWGKYRLIGNVQVDGHPGIPDGWVYIVEGTYSLTISGDGVQWASVMGPGGIHVSLSNMGGLTGTVTNIIAHGLEYSEIVTETFTGQQMLSKSGTWAAVVSHNELLQIAAGGSAGVYGHTRALDHRPNLSFNYSGSGKGTMSITKVRAVPPIQTNDTPGSPGHRD